MPLLTGAAVSPEVQAFEWLDVGTVAGAAFSSMNTAFTPINAFQVRTPLNVFSRRSLRDVFSRQAEEFAAHGRTMRDPMFLTMMVALEIETFPSFASIKRHTARLEPEAELAAAQWLWDGMTVEE